MFMAIRKKGRNGQLGEARFSAPWLVASYGWARPTGPSRSLGNSSVSDSPPRKGGIAHLGPLIGSEPNPVNEMPCSICFV